MLKNAAYLVFTSIWYETFGRTIVEAFASGKPVIASRLGTAVELIDEGVTGLFFEPRNAEDLALKAAYLWESVEARKSMGRNARACYEEKFTIEKNYQALIDIYSRAMEPKT
jgi:glycosyltransferase involved in cell wall biosynthesis